MLKIKPFKQKIAFCGPASLKMVLEYYGVKKTERELGVRAGCTTARGTPAKGLISAAREFGFRGTIKEFADLKDIRRYVIQKKIPVIVQWFSVDEGHYSVVVDIDKENIYLQDPEIGRMRSMRLDAFKRVWFDFPGDFLRAKSDIVVRRMIVIEPGENRKK